jgi:RIO kinase 1
LNYQDFDRYAEYEAEFDPLRHDRRARRRRKPQARHIPKKTDSAIIREIAQTGGLESGFNPTYTPGLFEEGWLLDALRPFYEQQLITDVLAQIKGGKEATVYRCEANPSTEHDLLAAKVYRPRMFRNLRNDRLYREGRAVLKSNGKAIKNNDHRLQRALGKKTALGEQIAHTSWLMYEYTTLQKLFAAGGDVPQPTAVSDNAILMGYCGDRFEAAHTLNELRLGLDEAASLVDRVLRNVELMLQHGLIHGDLSAYNILYWEGEITLIDFPQVTEVETNASAYFILRRDIQRVCDYFAQQGIERDAQVIMDDLWGRWVGSRPHNWDNWQDDEA